MNIEKRQNGSSGQAPSGAWNRRSFLIAAGGIPLVTLVSGSALPAAAADSPDDDSLVLENDVLKVSLRKSDASIAVFDKRNSALWRQQVSPGFRVAAGSGRVAGETLSARVEGSQFACVLTLKFSAGAPHALDLVIDVADHRYTLLPAYPFPFAAPAKDWYFVQNTTGEGMLMPLAEPAAIHKPFGWGGSQPWWGLTDLDRAMRARLDTFRLPDPKDDREDETVYASPLKINYAFLASGGYVGLAKEYRAEFLRSHSDMQPLAARSAARPAVDHLKDSVYVYLWGENPADDLQLVSEMQAAGIERGIAIVYGRHEIDRALCDGIKQLGWIVGTYKMPMGNLFQVSKRRHWPAALLTGQVDPKWLFEHSHQDAWDRVCGTQVVKEWPAKARALIDEYGLQLFYFDTLVVQLAVCLHPDHPQTIEENQASRREIMRLTRELGMLVGSGEGNCPTWALPEVDFFEGQMSLRTYSDTSFSVAGGGFATDLGEAYRDQAATALDETRR
ncbi:MAG TPA: hypothetical protein VHY20_12120, partial [Pirellulales bacterium]|nr:hypothetical protein [Pirellulales bacterium]